jgi:UDPglucose 6-dehydrogenase
MRIAVIGTGYVGLVSGVCLAEKGHTVKCVDIDEEKVRRINGGEPPIFEVSLPELLKKNLRTRFLATTDLKEAVMSSDLTLIAVGTPFDGREIDLSYVRTVASDIGKVLREIHSYHVVVVKSTVVPGTTDSVVAPLLEEYSGKKAGSDFGVGMNPEFLTEGQAIQDFMKPDRIVLGGVDDRTLDVMAGLYSSFEGTPVIRTNTRTAEMIKYASNALLATMISFANELATVSAAVGEIDAIDVMEGVHASLYLTVPCGEGRTTRPPITSFLLPGCGFGGSCLPKDVSALVSHGRKHGVNMPLLDAVMTINRNQPGQILSILQRHFPTFANVRVAVLGLAFKPDTDDIRETPAIPILRELIKAGAQVKAYDPVANAAIRRVITDPLLTFADTMKECIRDAKAIVIVTRWDEFRQLPDLLKDLPVQPLIVDGRRMIDPRSVARYAGIGFGDAAQ